MIIAKDFVLVSLQKTGTLYVIYLTERYNEILSRKFPVVSNLIRRAATYPRYGKKPYKLIICMMIRSFVGVPFYYLSERHDACYQIPVKESHKEIISVLRNPYDQMVSSYSYARTIGTRHTSFNSFLRGMVNVHVPECARRIGVNKLELTIGALTFHFIRIYFKDPWKILSMSEQAFNDYFDGRGGREYKKDLYKVKFFRLETLDEQLYAYLRNKPHIDAKVLDETFAGKDRIHKNKSRDIQEEFWTEENKAYFEKTEKVYIQMVKELAPLPRDQF